MDRRTPTRIGLTIVALSLSLTLLASDKVKTKTLAIMPFTDQYGRAVQEGEQLSLLAFAELSSTPNINLVERSRLLNVMEEQNLVSLNKDSKEVFRFGKIVGADYLVFGTFFKVRSKRFFNCHIINCQSGAVKGFSAEITQKDTEKMLSGLAKKIKQQVAGVVEELHAAHAESGVRFAH